MLKVLFALILSVAAAHAGAQWAPTKPVRIVVPFPAGGIVDLMARAVNDKLGTALGQPVIIEAKPGAGGSIGTDAVAKSPPDGHTLVLATMSHAVLPAFVDLPWHPSKDFAGVAMLGQVSNLVVVTPALPPKTMKEFVQYAKTRPGQVNYVNAGYGTSQSLGVELLKKNAGLFLTPIGYRGFPPAMADLISGQLQFALVPYGVGLPHVQSGKLRALAVVAPVRSRHLPNVPTMAEAGFPDSDVTSWYALLAPAGTPKAALQRINEEITKILADPETAARMERIGGTPLPAGTPADVDAMLVREAAKWAGFVKERGLRIE